MTDKPETGKITFENGSDSFMPKETGNSAPTVNGLPDALWISRSGCAVHIGTTPGDVRYIRADLVDVEQLKQEADSFCKEHGPHSKQSIKAFIDYIAAHYNLTRKGE